MIPITTAIPLRRAREFARANRREIFRPRDNEGGTERVFTCAWPFVGHESQVSNPSDFFTAWALSR